MFKFKENKSNSLGAAISKKVSLPILPSVSIGGSGYSDLAIGPVKRLSKCSTRKSIETTREIRRSNSQLYGWAGSIGRRGEVTRTKNC